MQLICKHCAYISKSLILPQDKALGEVLKDFTKHVMNSHGPGPQENIPNSPYQLMMQDLGMITALSATVVLLSKHTTLLDNFDAEDYIRQKFSDVVDQLEDHLGVEVFDTRPTPLPVEGEATLSLPQMT